MSLAARVGGGREPGQTEAAEVMSRQPGADGSVVPVRRFVVIVGQPADRGSANRIEDPARLVRLLLLLQATHDQLAGTALPPDGMPGLQRQLQVFGRELDRAVSRRWRPSCAGSCHRSMRAERQYGADRVRGAGDLGQRPGPADARRVCCRARAGATGQRGVAAGPEVPPARGPGGGTFAPGAA